MAKWIPVPKQGPKYGIQIKTVEVPETKPYKSLAQLTAGMLRIGVKQDKNSRPNLGERSTR